MLSRSCQGVATVAAATLLSLSMSQTAGAQSSFEDAVLRELTCRQEPSPLPILEALERAGKIHASEMLGLDSISCFRISGGIEIAGMRFNSVCAHEERVEVSDRRPDLLWRGPGTSPGQLLSFGTSAADQVAARWYFDEVGNRHLNEAIRSAGTYIGDATEVECSSWFSG